MYKNKLDKLGTCAKDGKSAEEQFRKLAEQRGYTVKDACLDKQFAHIDFTLEKDGHEYHFEVKARKKLRRKDDSYCSEWTWLELRNILGNDGWIFGAADFIVFEREFDFVVVNRESLPMLVEKYVNREKVVDKPHLAKYCSYRRFRRKDEICLVETEKILEYPYSLWPKES